MLATLTLLAADLIQVSQTLRTRIASELFAWASVLVFAAVIVLLFMRRVGLAFQVLLVSLLILGIAAVFPYEWVSELLTGAASGSGGS